MVAINRSREGCIHTRYTKKSYHNYALYHAFSYIFVLASARLRNMGPPSSNVGHSIESCVAFKKRILELIKIGWVTVEDLPNVNLNPLPKHVGGSSRVNVVEVGNKSKSLKVTMTRQYDMLVQYGHSEKLTEYGMLKNDIFLIP